MSHLTYPAEEFSDRVEAIREALASKAAVLSAATQHLVAKSAEVAEVEKPRVDSWRGLRARP